MMIDEPIGYVLHAADNDSYLIDSQSDIVRCVLCENIIRNTTIFDKFKLRKKRYDFSYTYDGFLIVSSKFKISCVKSGIGGVIFHPLPQESKFYVAEIQPILHFDSERRGTSFKKLCSQCNQYEEITGVSPPYLKDPSRLLGLILFRSDLLFGRLDSKSYLVIASNEIVKKFQSDGLKGLSLDPIPQ